jgi:hypothetical protein
MEKRPGRLRRFWRATRRRIPGLRASEPPPPQPRWPDAEDDLVPVGPPRRPLPGAAAALELPTDADPQVYPTETDAVGESWDEDDGDDESGRVAAL